MQGPYFEENHPGLQGRERRQGNIQQFDGNGPHFEGSGPHFEGNRPPFERDRLHFEGNRPPVMYGPNIQENYPPGIQEVEGQQLNGQHFNSNEPHFEGYGPHFEGDRPLFEMSVPNFEENEPYIGMNGPIYEGEDYQEWFTDGMEEPLHPLKKKGKRKKKKKSKPTSICQRWCPLLYRFFTSGPDEYLILKQILGFPIGLLFATGLYYAVIDSMRFTTFVKYTLGTILGIMMSGGFAMSIQVRCITILLIPFFLGKEGRSYIATFAIALILSGPVVNIVQNAKEVKRSLACHAELGANQTLARLELKLKPIHDVMLDLQRQGKEIHNITSKIKKEFKPFENEVEDKDEIEEMKADSDYVDGLEGQQKSRTLDISNRHEHVNKAPNGMVLEQGYEEKMEFRCEDVYSKAVIECRKTFRSLESKCMKAAGVIGHLFCWVFKLTQMCALLSLVPSSDKENCESGNALNEGFGEGYKTAEDSANAFDDNFDVNMQYKIETTKESIETYSVKDAAKEMNHAFDEKVKWFQFCMTAIKRILAFMFLRVFLSALRYHKNYIGNFEGDNVYIVSYFKRIDARRYKQGKRTLLPLKKLERKNYIDPLSFKLMGPEKSKLVSSTFKLLLRVISVSVIIYMDYFIYEVLDMIRRHSRVDYRQTGEHHIQLIINGNGAVAHLIKSILNGFNKKHAIDEVTTNFACLPNPVGLDTQHIYKIFGIFAIIWICMVFEAYGLRLRRVICQFFYPKREKKRILHLYNDVLKKRKGFLRHAQRRIKALARERKLSIKSNVLTSIRNEYPMLCGWLGMFGSSKKKCLICEEPENKNFYNCHTPGCNFGYCGECWIDMKEICYACLPEEDFNDDSTYTDVENF
ncbi:unnamed protein product [Owenia fusiformis]|uniref:Dendritic cell-specific transmembrane protein-like domain-containing protein n=1 Tax=Owenia fusiformis TaxID=6347 RepID=A0A8J1TU94_OWEFU|nr:unnamed protein product [Owenia fusiformis]